MTHVCERNTSWGYLWKLKNLSSLQEYVPIPNTCILHQIFLKTYSHEWPFNLGKCHFLMWILENYFLFFYNSATKIINVTFQVCCKLSLTLTNPNHSSDQTDPCLTNLQQWPNSDKENLLHSPMTLCYFLWGSFSSTSVPNLIPTTGLHFSDRYHLLLSISSCCLTCSCSYTRMFSIPISSQNSRKTTSSTFENREMEQIMIILFWTHRCEIFNHSMLQTRFLRYFKKTPNNYWEVIGTWNFQKTLSVPMPDIRHM